MVDNIKINPYPFCKKEINEINVKNCLLFASLEIHCKCGLSYYKTSDDMMEEYRKRHKSKAKRLDIEKAKLAFIEVWNDITM